jgi:hypothetical protein
VRVLLLLFAFVVSSDNEVTLRIPLQPGEPEEIAVVSFDEDRVSAENVKKWMLLHETSYYHTPAFGVYPECKTTDISKLEDDIHKTEQLVNDLDPKSYPKELTDVVLYLRNLQSFWLWLTQQELAFLKSGKLPPTEYNGLDLVACQVPVDKTHACTQIFFDWHSCANSQMAKRLGSYPKEKWKAFLDAFGIQERLESTVD